MEIKSKLYALGLDPHNAVVIGSGILSALHLRESKDIDVVIPEEKYEELSKTRRFKKGQNHGNEVLTQDVVEIGTRWTVLGKTWKFADLLRQSTVIDGVRYITVEFLLSVKRGWLMDGSAREKDKSDVRLMEQYLSDLNSPKVKP
ncbi:MAG: hypothetical protein FJY98_00785 [Candidatus Liptonbacteria bacterium]|nr:hypothetical protein [Candidatus Liptonbacteria bacterium]